MYHANIPICFASVPLQGDQDTDVVDNVPNSFERVHSDNFKRTVLESIDPSNPPSSQAFENVRGTVWLQNYDRGMAVFLKVITALVPQ